MNEKRKYQTVEGLRNMVELLQGQSDFAKMRGAETLISGLVDVVEVQDNEIQALLECVEALSAEVELLRGAIYGNRTK